MNLGQSDKININEMEEVVEELQGKEKNVNNE
jgi:hypothetical protein